ncbi:hypothetical protein BDK51DRAFT_50408 [Blyttiomyces helicus]|uniref:Uncharacterized protein n=1 Tax=Blyttiomyces helicus TaxID=388810 RepID=A0A4P9W2Y3_9FUNG|nr:hypothetical protein BDK51DRAFT_50408 [Blyttiomyces helicus]|eukprot:RKO86621.1 hypothetical protein BDK51DRAFT_50408 [Blyttiomyces helicus]
MSSEPPDASPSLPPAPASTEKASPSTAAAAPAQAPAPTPASAPAPTPVIDPKLQGLTGKRLIAAQRRILAEDPEWNLAPVDKLSELCVRVIVSNFGSEFVGGGGREERGWVRTCGVCGNEGTLAGRRKSATPSHTHFCGWANQHPSVSSSPPSNSQRHSATIRYDVQGGSEELAGPFPHKASTLEWNEEGCLRRTRPATTYSLSVATLKQGHPFKQANDVGSAGGEAL